jgi:hypothetical protein
VSDTVSDDAAITPRQARRLLLWIVVGLFVTLGLILLLPDDPYIRYQQANGSDLFHLQWIYERIHDDKAPIDVAIIGTSRLEAGVSPVLLSETMSAAERRKVAVSNLALFESGRDFSFAVAKKLVEDHPEVRMIVVSLDEDVEQSHPIFKYIADKQDLATAPFGWNRMYFANLFFIPYRLISYNVQALAPALFGISPAFSQAAYLGSDLDRTWGYRIPAGDFVNGNQTQPLAQMLYHARDVVTDHERGLHHAGRLPADAVLPIERGYTRRIADLCRQHHIKLVFLHLPVLGTASWPHDRAFYESEGSVVAPDPSQFASGSYVDGVHLNRQGAVIASRWLGPQLAPLDTSTTR